MELKDVAKITGSIAAIGMLSMSAFSRPSRREIMERARYKSELSERNDRPRECSHLNHYFQRYYKEEYNSPDNGVYCLDIEHYAYHLMFRAEPHLIGMTLEGNEYALDKIHDRIARHNSEYGLKMDWKHEVSTASNLWQARLSVEA